MKKKNLTKLKLMPSKRTKKKQRVKWVLKSQFLDIGTLEV